MESGRQCKSIIRQRLLAGSERCRRLSGMMTSYFDKECELLTKEHPIHNISSDIIESDFGLFKDSMPSNKTNGFTESILCIPLRTKLGVLQNVKNMDIKAVMERRTVKDVEKWKKETLRPSPMIKRKNLLVA